MPIIAGHLVSNRELDYFCFLKEQMEVRKSDDPNKIGRDKSCTDEYMVLNMCWEKLANLIGFYHVCGDMPKLWKAVEKYQSSHNDKREPR